MKPRLVLQRVNGAEAIEIEVGAATGGFGRIFVKGLTVAGKEVEG
ncbi:hypothetical protein SAMN06298215_0521 [Bacteroidales bacterium WCE2008]|nr:hypothetical protein SAMN06298215_0521 [Bacteroidales bacterium WCE2008]